MICFLTSRTDLPGAEHFRMNEANGFVERLRRCFPKPCRALDICSDPDDAEKMDFYSAILRESFEEAGFHFECFRTLDGRNRADAATLVREADFLILSGGHVPTQNRFFTEIKLKELLRDFDGVLVGISAGSMNCAEMVYAQPELPGEAVDPAYRRFFPGLGLTRQNILPHYQEIKDDVLDGLRVMEDIAYPDSLGRRFLVLPDGSYLYLESGRETICGRAWQLADGELAPICADGQTLAL